MRTGLRAWVRREMAFFLAKGLLGGQGEVSGLHLVVKGCVWAS